MLVQWLKRWPYQIFAYVQQYVSNIAHCVKSSLIASFPMTNSKWVTWHILWKAVSLHPFWPTASEWHCTFCERQSHCIFSYDQQYVSDIAHFVKGSLIASFPMTNSLWVTLHILWKAVSLHLFLWPTASEWHYTFCERQSHCIFSYDQQGVSDIAHFVKGSLIASCPMTNSLWVTLHILWKAVSLHLFLWPTASEWHCKFCERQSHCIFSYDQQLVSDIAHFVKGSLIASFPMTHSEWVTLHILWKAVSLHLLLWPTGSEWHCSSCERQSHCIFCYDQQQVSDIAHFVKGSLIASVPMTNRESVTLHILWKAVSLHLFLWPTGSEWHCTVCERQSHYIFCYDQQEVSDIADFVKGSLIASVPMTNRMWVTLHILWEAVSLHLFLWPTGSEWHCTFVKGSLIESFPMMNRLWVTLHILWKAVSLHLLLWPTASEWHCTFCERQSHCIFSYDQQRVSDIAHFVKGSLIASFPMTNSKWVTLHILWKAVSLHLVLWLTAGEWYCTFCERQFHCIFSYDQQLVSDIAHFGKGSLIASFPMTNREWVTLHILWKAISLHVFLWPTGSEWHCTFCERQSHCIFSYDQQDVSDIAHFVKGNLIASFLITNSKWVTLCTLRKAVSLHLVTNSLWVTFKSHCVKGSLIASFPVTNSEWVTLHILWKQSDCIFSHDQ